MGEPKTVTFQISLISINREKRKKPDTEMWSITKKNKKYIILNIFSSLMLKKVI